MAHKSVRVFLSPGDLIRVQKVRDAEGCTISTALAKLIRAGAKALDEIHANYLEAHEKLWR